MTIAAEKEGKKLTLFVEGHVDSSTAPELEAEINKSIDDIEDFVLDLEKVEYVSSAGLRVMLSASKKLANKGSMKIVNSTESVKEIFDMTGFSEILDIE